MFCSKCGQEIRDDAVVCVHCGASTAAAKPPVYNEPPVTERVPEPKNNGYAIAGFITSFFLTIVPLVLCIIGLVKVKTIHSGKGFAIAGIVITALKVVLSIASVIITIIIIKYFADTISDGFKNVIDSIIPGLF